GAEALEHAAERGHEAALHEVVEPFEDVMDALAEEGFDRLAVDRQAFHVAVVELPRAVLEAREARVAIDRHVTLRRLEAGSWGPGGGTPSALRDPRGGARQYRPPPGRAAPGGGRAPPWAMLADLGEAPRRTQPGTTTATTTPSKPPCWPSRRATAT